MAVTCYKNRRIKTALCGYKNRQQTLLVLSHKIFWRLSAGGGLVINAIDTQLGGPVSSGLAKWLLTVYIAAAKSILVK